LEPRFPHKPQSGPTGPLLAAAVYFAILPCAPARQSGCTALSCAFVRGIKSGNIRQTAVFVDPNVRLGVREVVVQGKRASFRTVIVHSVHNSILPHIFERKLAILHEG